MKVGGNESATRFFQSHGGTAALASKDPKVKYTSNAAVKYKDELKRRAADDAKQYPDEVVITDIMSPSEGGDGTSTPSGEPDDDFFSSWDKPTIKRPTPPISRGATPPVVGRTPSPFLSAGTGTNGAGSRPKSPLAAGGEANSGASTPATVAPRTTSSAALRKSTTSGGGARKAVLGAKKTQKLGAKKISSGDSLDFEAVERKAKEEAERLEKLGYDAAAEEEEAKKKAAVEKSGSKIISPYAG